MLKSSIIQRYPVASYFVLVYGLTWGGILLIAQVLTSSGQTISSDQVGLVALPMLFAPGLVAMSLTLLLDGRAGVRAMWARLTHWRVALGWYGLALIGMPFLLLVILLVLTVLVSANYTPTLALLGLAGLFAGYMEEIGWTGFATPRLLSRWSPLVAGLGLGLLWGVWHGLADYIIRGNTLGAFWPVTFSFFVLPLIAWRILMTWMYDQTQSGILAQLMHFSYTGSLGLFIPVTQLSPQQDAWVYVLLTGALWVGVAYVVLRQRRLSQPIENLKSERLHENI